jgi:hypothetical protein
MATAVAPDRKVDAQRDSDEQPFTLGSVWMVQLIRVKPGHNIEYMRDLAATDKRLFEELKKEGLILSYKILGGMPASREDFNTIVMIEYPNYAAFDKVEKYDEVRRRVIGSLGEAQQFAQKRAEIREVIGAKVMQENRLK